MESRKPSKITIKKTEKSRIDQLDFDDIKFGNIFTDHMFECDWENGQWHNPRIVPYGPISVSPAIKVFHYGQAVFEGMKAYKDQDDKVYLFRPEENFNRINKSSKRMAIPEIPREIFFEALTTLVDMDRSWVPKGEGDSLYIRPFSIATEPNVGATPSDRYKFMIIMTPATTYYSSAIPVQIAQKYSRAANGGVGAAKAAGNYGAQFYPTNLAREKGFVQVIWTDDHTHEYLEEAGTMNVFFRINDTLITAPTSERILDGVTRKSIIEIAKRNGINVEVRPITITELVEASKKGTLQEIFGTGTAATISPINAFDFNETLYEIDDQNDSYAKRFKKELQDIQANRAEDPFGWRYEVKSKN